MQYTFRYYGNKMWVAPEGLDSCEAAMAFTRATGCPIYSAIITFEMVL